MCMCNPVLCGNCRCISVGDAIVFPDADIFRGDNDISSAVQKGSETGIAFADSIDVVDAGNGINDDLQSAESQSLFQPLLVSDDEASTLLFFFLKHNYLPFG